QHARFRDLVDPRGFGPSCRIVALPGPMGRSEMQAQQPGLLLPRPLLQEANATLGKEISIVSYLLYPHVAVPQIVIVADFVSEIVDAPTAVTPELVIAALQRPEVGQPAQMPFADESGAIAQLAQQRGQGRMLRRKPQRRIAERLFQPGAQPILIAPGNQSEAGRTADRAVG